MAVASSHLICSIWRAGSANSVSLTLPGLLPQFTPHTARILYVVSIYVTLLPSSIPNKPLQKSLKCGDWLATLQHLMGSMPSRLLMLAIPQVFNLQTGAIE